MGRTLEIARSARWLIVIAMLVAGACSGTSGGESIDESTGDDATGDAPVVVVDSDEQQEQKGAVAGSPIVVLGTEDSNVVTIHGGTGGDEPRQVTFDGPAAPFAITPRGQHVIVMVNLREEPQFHLLDTATGETTLFYTSRNFPRIDGWSFDGDWLAFSDPGQDTEWTVVNTATGETLTPGDQAPQWPPSFAADEPLLIYSTPEGVAKLIDLSDGNSSDLGQRGIVVGISPSGKRIVTSDESGTWTFSALETDESVAFDDVREVVGWLDDDTPIVMTGDTNVALADLESGEMTLLGGRASSRVSGGPIMVAEDSGEQGLVYVLELPSGLVTNEEVPDDSPITGASWQNDRYVWGFIGGTNGSVENLGGWVLDRESGDVTRFEQALGDDAFFGEVFNAYNADRSATIMSDYAGGLYLAQPGAPLERLPIEEATQAAFCPDGSIVGFRPDTDQPAQLHNAGTYELHASFEPADWVLCAAASAPPSE